MMAIPRATSVGTPSAHPSCKDDADSTTVFIVDDDEAFRDSVRELVSSVGYSAEMFASAGEFLKNFDPTRPGCLVVDVRLPRMNGLALQEQLIEAGARIPIIFISGHGDIAMAVQAIKNGAVDFVQKPYREQHLLDAINEALLRDTEQRAREGATSQGLDAKKLATLTARERSVMSLSLTGLTCKIIARELSISPRTVEQHRGRLLEKLGVSSIIELMRLAANTHDIS